VNQLSICGERFCNEMGGAIAALAVFNPSRTKDNSDRIDSGEWGI
jgi:hypothetical protein